MKRSYRGVITLSLVLLASIVSTQKCVNAFFYTHYESVILWAGLNLILFPLALWIYRKERDNI